MTGTRLANAGTGHHPASRGNASHQCSRLRWIALIEIYHPWDPPGGDAMVQCGFEPDRVLAVAPPVPGQGPGVVVDEREQVRLAARDDRAMQRVTGPAVIGGGGLE